uniref:Gypsy retrotransposon integrase-like protein 1 n=1 Tax=Leptobrachium leishanense TaxID=445787 RepID=A0A8C5MRX3_9ANUR
MKAPTSRKELETSLGIFNYLSKFSQGLAQQTAPLRALLQKDAMWSWDANMEKTFDKVKKVITKHPGPILKYFDVNCDTTLQVDASQFGLGAVLIQQGHPVAYASRALTTTQANYAQIEKEMLAIVNGCEKFHQYIYGRPVVVETDHKSLEYILQKPLSSVPPRLQRMVMKLQRYDLTVKYKPGKEIPMADTLSRVFPDGHEARDEPDLEEQVHTVLVNIPISDVRLEMIRQDTKQDKVLEKLIRVMCNGWPEKRKKLCPELQGFWPVRNELSIHTDIIFMGDCILIPKAQQAEVLDQIHQGHLGITLCKRRAREVIYWPNLDLDIESLVEKCETCQTFKKNNAKEPLTPWNSPSRAWQRLATDIFHFEDNHYLIVVDYYSKYFELVHLKNLTASTVIWALKTILSRHGVCEELVSDNGPQFLCSEFQCFLRDWGVRPIPTSPYHPQANGLAEKYVGIAKFIIRKAQSSGQDVYLGLLNYRATPMDGLCSPAQLLMGRALRTTVPIAPHKLQPHSIPQEQVAGQRNSNVKKQELYFDKNTKSLHPLRAGQAVKHRVTGDTWEPARIVSEANSPRSYVIETECGSQLRRNRRHLRPDTASDTPLGQPNDDENKEQNEDRTEFLVTDIMSTEDLEDSISVSSCDNAGGDSQLDIDSTDSEPAVTFSRYGRAFKPKLWKDFVSY